MTASPGAHGGCTQAPGWGQPPFPLCSPARRLIAALLQANPDHPSQPLHICIMSLRKHDAQPQPRSEQKPSACSLPHPNSEPQNNLLPLPKSQQRRACLGDYQEFASDADNNCLCKR
ncbi:hypothetical protein DV515_00007333 [Chloebia gouldiae]|uniref:Uncharacterized protein n=1 Tax=Chloebia gouldiae TaxID=44316 RepID=A0A3L8SIF4_CHLGU|nr:hypothetical protein DV515_00007333 [Chloebia gouldiae]